MPYIYQADLWCDSCGEVIRKRLDAEGKTPTDDLFDSGDYPAYASDNDESDSPQHCASGADCLEAEELWNGQKVGCLFGSLTSDGEDYVKQTHAEKPSAVTALWMERFDLSLPEPDDDEPTEPEESDITTTDHEKFYQDGRLVLERERRYDGTLTDRWYSLDKTNTMTLLIRGELKNAGPQHYGDDHKAALRAYMSRVQFWPNVWFISDHGNAHLMDLGDSK